MRKAFPLPLLAFLCILAGCRPGSAIQPPAVHAANWAVPASEWHTIGNVSYAVVNYSYQLSASLSDHHDATEQQAALENVTESVRAFEAFHPELEVTSVETPTNSVQDRGSIRAIILHHHPRPVTSPGNSSFN